MQPLPEARRVRQDGPLAPLDSLPTVNAVCACIAAQLRYGSVSGEEIVHAYIDVAQPWRNSSFPMIATDSAMAVYCQRLEEVILTNFAAWESVVASDPTLRIFFRKVIIKSHYEGIFRISISAMVVAPIVLTAV